MLIAFTGSETFRHSGWLLFYEQLLDCPRQSINIGFIIYSAVILVSSIFVPVLIKRSRISENHKKMSILFGVSFFAALVFRFGQLSFGISAAYIFLTLWTAAIMVCICICFMSMADTASPSVLGRFAGIAYFADAVITSLIETLTGTVEYFYASMAAGVLLFAAASLSFRKISNNYTEWDEQQSDNLYPSTKLIRIGLILLIVYAIIAGMTDNLYFFDEMFELPYVGVFFIPMTGIMYLSGGFIFDKISKKNTLPVALIFICAAQAIAFFMKDSIFAYTYSVLFSAGSTFLEITIILLPIFFVQKKRNNYHLSAFGGGIFYGGFCVTSILFLFIEQSAYLFIMGLVLLGAVIYLFLIMKAISLYEKEKLALVLERQKAELSALENKLLSTASVLESASPSLEACSVICLTKKERELLPLIVSPLTAEEIAQQENLSPSTIRFHIKNILSKTNAKNRRELARMLSNQLKDKNDTTQEHNK